MTCENGVPFSDSVNLGSNPSSPATGNADVSGVSGGYGPVEQPDTTEQTAHGDRTKVGTVTDARVWTQDEIDEQMFGALEAEDDDENLWEAEMNCHLHPDGQCGAAGSEWCEFECQFRSERAGG